MMPEIPNDRKFHCLDWEILLEGFDAIPQIWVEQLARKQDIIDLAKRLEQAIEKDVFS